MTLPHSDVSRISDISIQAYLRTASPNSAQGQGGANHADMGNADLAVGGVRFTPDLETQVSVGLQDLEEL